MRLFREQHTHQWEVVGVLYNPPMEGFKGKNIGSELLRELVYGITTLTQQCTDCGYTSVTRHAGRINYDGYTGN